MAGPVKSVFTSIGSLFGAGQQDAPKVPEAPPPPPVSDPSAQASAAAEGARVRADFTPEQTTFAGNLGESTVEGRRRKRLLGF